MSRKIPTAILRVATASILAYSLMLGYLYAAQESLIFVGTKLPADHEFEFDLPYRELTIDVDGAALNALHFLQPDPRGLVFFLHGNGGNLRSWTTGADYYQRVNYDMFMLDYRGYGKSTGEIVSEKQLHADVRVAWDTIAPEYAGKPIVLYGRSLGAALAVRLATEVEPDLVILVSPFSSMLAMASAQYPIVPTALVRYPLRSDEIIANVQAPIVFVHGDRDTFIPIDHSIELRELATSATSLLTIEGADHYDIHRYSSYLEGLADVLPDGQ